MQQTDLVIFDLDGTLVDTATDVHISLNLALEKMGLPLISLEIAKKAIGPGPKEFIGYVLGDSVERAEELREIFRPIYWQRCADNAEVFDGMLDLIHSLKKQHIKCAVATNKEYEGMIRVLKGLELDAHFDLLLSRDAVAHPKPAPDMILKACETLDVSPDRTLMLGDTNNDLLAAQAAGAQSCLVRWGYSHDIDALTKMASFSIDHPRDLLYLLKSEILEHV